MKNKTINALLEMGMPANNKGFQYIVDAMVMFEDDEVRNGKITYLYRLIAKKHNASWSNVERCIRNAFEVVLTRGNLKAVEKYLTMQSPTNGNLLHTLYLRLTQED